MISELSLSGSEIFECQNCGRCCHGFGGTYVTTENIADIADYLGVDFEAIKKYCCRTSGEKTVLAQKPDGYCVFWDENCTIHPVKPRMCRAWPFIESVLRAPENWQVMANACPGINPDVSERALRRCVRREISRLAEQNAILP